MIQDEAFTLFMRGLRPRILEQIVYHMEGDLGELMAIVEKSDM